MPYLSPNTPSDLELCSGALNQPSVYASYSGFSLTPYLESFTPIFGLGTPVFQRISSNLHSGTPTFSKICLWDSCFQNSSENPDTVPGCLPQQLITLPVIYVFAKMDNTLRFQA